MSALEKALQSIQQDADTKMEELCQVLYQDLVDELRLRYPKRRIEIIFGMGTVIVCGFENTRFSDGYALEARDSMYIPYYNMLPAGHPLKSLIDLQSDAVYPSNGYSICCEDIK